MDRIPQVTVLAGSLRKEPYNRRRTPALKAMAQGTQANPVASQTDGDPIQP